MRLALLVPLLLLAGCANRSRFRPATTDTEKLFSYSEQDRRGVNHPISTADVKQVEPERVPQPAMVDMRSTILVQVGKLPAEPDALDPQADVNQLTLRKEKLEALLVEIEALIPLRVAAVEAYLADDDDLFVAARIKYGDATVAFTDAVILEYDKPETAELYDALEAADEDGTWRGMRDFLKQEVEQIEAQDRALSEAAEARKTTVTLQAFLEQPGNQGVPIHLEGYDSLDKLDLVRGSSSGLDLSPEQRKELQEQFQRSRDLAQTLNGLKDKELNVEEAIREALPKLAPRLNADLVELEGVLTGLADPVRLQRVQDNVAALVTSAKAEATRLREAGEAELNVTSDTFLLELRKESQPVLAVARIVGEVKGLEDGFTSLREPEDLVRLLEQLDELKTAGEKLINNEDWKKALNKILESGALGARTAFEGVLASQEATQLTEDLTAYASESQQAIDIVARISKQLTWGRREASVAPDSPELFKLSPADLENTFLELGRVPGKPGDRVSFEAKVQGPGEVENSSRAQFELTQYGWWGRLSPSVVLVKPTGSSSFQFAPVVSWNQHYRPRPEDKGWYNSLSRTMEPSFGIHAAFLPYDPSNNVAIGLGGTLAFWEDRLQFGLGYDLMASSATGGEVYWFVGSDLIGLLQAVGIGN